MKKKLFVLFFTLILTVSTVKPIVTGPICLCLAKDGTVTAESKRRKRNAAACVTKNGGMNMKNLEMCCKKAKCNWCGPGKICGVKK